MIDNVIRYVDLEILDEEEQSRIKSIVNREYEKVHMMIHNITNLIIHVKEFKKTGKSKKYDIKIRLESPAAVLSAHASDWDLNRTVHSAMTNLINEINHKFKL